MLASFGSLEILPTFVGVFSHSVVVVFVVIAALFNIQVSVLKAISLFLVKEECIGDSRHFFDEVVLGGFRCFVEVEMVRHVAQLYESPILGKYHLTPMGEGFHCFVVLKQVLGRLGRLGPLYVVLASTPEQKAVFAVEIAEFVNRFLNRSTEQAEEGVCVSVSSNNCCRQVSALRK